MISLNESLDKYVEGLIDEENKIVTDELGWFGKMLSGSKSLYREQNLEHFVIFNSILCTDEVEIWYGDMDVTLSKKELCNVSKKLNRKLYLFHESDGKFKDTKAPKIDKAAVVIGGDSIVLRQYDWKTKGVKEIPFNKYKPE